VTHDLPHSVTAGSAFWRTVFGRDAPVEIEIGSGDGAFLTTRAAAFPARSLLGLERSPAKARRLAERIAKRPLPNVRALQADARCLIATVIPPASVAAYHVYFPDPWPKRAHATRRLFAAAFASDLVRTLEPDGRLFFATDVGDYATVTRARLLATEGLREIAVGDDHPGLTTSFARKYRARGRALYAFTFVRADRASDAQLLAASKMRSM
jgi:tRNA (guanine-N7-)-methyltransferase